MIEPYQEERFEYKGYPCVILFMPMCHRCGYVGLPKTSKFYGKGYDEIDVDCNGGLTYARNYLSGQEDKETWWIGFDCGHCWDLHDFKSAYKHFAEDEEALKQIKAIEDIYINSACDDYATIKTQEFVLAQCERIVDQIIKLESEVN